MDLTQSELQIISAAIGDHIETLIIRSRVGDRDAIPQLRKVRAFADRVETAIRETALPVSTNRYTEDSEGMLWA